MALASLPTAWIVFFALRAAFVADRNHRGLVQHDAFAANVDQGVGGAKVNGQVGRELPTKRFKHGEKSCVAWARLRALIAGCGVGRRPKRGAKCLIYGQKASQDGYCR
jgi:hypothetical protein